MTVMTFRRDEDADFARLALEADGIRAIADGARVQVEESDVDAADAVLNRLAGMAGAEDAAPRDDGPWQPPESCPSCGAPAVVRRQKWVGFVVFAAFVFAIAYMQDATLLGFYIVSACFVFFLIAPRWRCRQCGHMW